MDNFRYFLMFLIFMISCAQDEAALAEGEFVVRKDTTDRCYICVGSEWENGNCAKVKCSGGETAFFPEHGANDKIKTRFITKSELLAGCTKGVWIGSRFSATWITNVQNETIYLKDL